MDTRTPNQKRKDSCKKVGGEKKRTGHNREREFNSLFGHEDAGIKYGAEADCDISNETPNGIHLNEQLKKHFIEMPEHSDKVSLKGGNTIQFTLGRIDEVSSLENSKKLNVFKNSEFWYKYLGKSMSKNQPGWFVYRDTKSWVFFRMIDVISFIATDATWRLLDSGRIKGDFKDSSKKGTSQYLTYEHRPSKGYFLGANGGQNGKKFVKLLTERIIHKIITDP
jgi:hypothetical protein